MSARAGLRAAVCVMVVALWPVSVAAVSDTVAKAERLDQLFADLQASAPGPRGADIEDEIIALWHQSGDDEIDGLMRLALSAMAAGALDQALGQLDLIVERKPDFAEGWNKRATVYYLQRRYAESLADIEKTLALEPRHFGALVGLGWIMMELDDTPRALQALKAAVAVNPTLEHIKQQIGELERAAGDRI